MNKLSLFVYQHTYRHFTLYSNRTLSSRNQSGWQFFIHKKLIQYIWTEKWGWNLFEQRPNEVFELRQEWHDEKDVDPKRVFHWSARVVYGRKGFSIKDRNVIRKKYGEEQRNYLLKEGSSLDSIHQTDILLSQGISLFLYEISWWNVHKSQTAFNF